MTNLTSEDIAWIREICREHGDEPAELLEILHEIQDIKGFIPEAALPHLAGALNIARAEVHGVVSFYHDFRSSPAGRVVVKVCRAEACQSQGALPLIEALCARHGIPLGGTSADGVTIEPVYCLGNCALAPAAMVQSALYGRVDANRLDALITEAVG